MAKVILDETQAPGRTNGEHMSATRAPTSSLASVV
jgi:hypothetical protein